MTEHKLPDRYQNIVRIGAGGMGEVYKATDRLLLIPVAIKVMRKSMSKEDIVRFQVEAKATGRLNHINIVSVLDFGTTEDNAPYMVMEFLEGENLANYLKQEEIVSTEVFLQIFLQVCSALSHAHKRKILHRDLKPSNLIVRTEEKKVATKLVDFGIAKLFEEDHSITSAGSILGSPLYMSPEQASGEEVDHRSDIYSMGCVMYECLAGSPPFHGSNALETMSMHKEDDPVPLTLFETQPAPPWLNAIVLKCMNKRLEERYQSVDDVRSALVRGYEESGIKNEAVNQTVAEYRPHGPSPIKLVTLLTVSIVFVVGVFAIIFTVQDRGLVKLARAPEKSDTSYSEKENRLLEFVSKPGVIVEKEWLKVNGLTDDELVQVAAYSGKRIDFSHCEMLNGDGLKYLVDRSPLALRFGSEIEDRNFHYFAEMKDLRYLKFSAVKNLDGSGFALLAPLKYFDEVDFAGCNVNDSTLENLSKIKSLTRIRIDNSTGFTAEGLSHLKARKLEVLSMLNTHLTDSMVAGLRGVTVLDISLANNPQITDKSCDVLKTLKSVQTFMLADTGITTPKRLSLAAALGLRYDPSAEMATKLTSATPQTK